MRPCRLWGLPLLCALALCGCGVAQRLISDEKEAKKGKNTDLGDINAEISVLQLFHALDLSDAQREQFGKLAAKCAGKAPPKKDFDVSDKYRKAMTDLRAALRENDGEKIGTTAEALDEIREKESADFDEVEITDEARKVAPGFFDKLSSRQIVFYLSALGDTFPDPVELMLAGLAESRELAGKEWQSRRDDIAFQVGFLVGGLDSAKDEKVRDKVTALLDKAAALKEKEYEKQKDDLQKAAREIPGKLTSLDFIRHYVERVLAEALSNYKAAAAVESRRKEKKE